MLKVTDVAAQALETIEFDDYVPFSVTWGETRPQHLHYWRTGDFKKSLMEVGIEPTSGLLHTVTLTLAEQVSVCRADQSLDGWPQRVGVPVCQHAWPANSFRDDPGRFNVCIGKNHLFLEFWAANPVTTVVVSGRLRFGLDSEHYLCALEIIELSEKEVAQLKIALNMKAEESKMKDKVNWLEVWIDSAAQGDYVLILKSIHANRLVIVDPQKNQEVVATFDHYEDAVHWLNEDEYDLVEGRWAPTD